MIGLRVLALAAGTALAVIVVDSAVRTFVLPRGVISTLTRLVFRLSRRLFETVAKPTRSYEARDRVMALYAPLTLVLLPGVWIGLILVGFTGVFWGLLGGSLEAAFRMSGSSLLTLGFDRPEEFRAVVFSFVEATLGLGIVALLISYLPTMYGGFARREAAVTRLSVRAGTPPSAVELLQRAYLASFLPALEQLFDQWEQWFVDLEESHTSLAALPFFRSPNPHRSWITAAGCVLDTAALRASALDLPFTPTAGVCIRSGFLALRAICDLFDQPYPADPAPTDPISITREEFDEALDQLAAVGVPLKADRDEAWRNFAGWRVNYDEPLLRMASLVMAPYAPWSSDRSLARLMPRLRRRTSRST
jgi:hypothetical protein